VCICVYIYIYIYIVQPYIYKVELSLSLYIYIYLFIYLYLLGPQLTSCQDLHQIEENHKVPKDKTTMGFGETVYSKTNSAGYSRRETRCN